MEEKSKKIIAAVLGAIGGVVGFVIGYTVVRALPPERIGLLLGGAAVGLLCGLIPFFIGRKKNQRKLGKIALLCCMVSGLVLGILLALPVAVIFSVVIAQKAKQTPAETEKPTETSQTDNFNQPGQI